MKTSTILLVEDDINILDANRAALEMEDYRVLTAETLKKARTITATALPDLIILDIMLPDGNGLTYCEELRGESGIRIIFLSAFGTKDDVLTGLRAGGDDYISKPYDMDELILRVKALLRRGRMSGREESLQVLGKLTLNHTSRRATLDGRDILLKPKEFTLLSILADRRGETVSAADLYKKVWGMDSYDNSPTVKEHISRIRSKLGENSGFSIISERRKGYRLDL